MADPDVPRPYPGPLSTCALYLNEATAQAAGRPMCAEDADAWTYHAALTPAERRAEEESIARHAAERVEA